MDIISLLFDLIAKIFFDELIFEVYIVNLSKFSLMMLHFLSYLGASRAGV
jgi:hypothetical protein